MEWTTLEPVAIPPDLPGRTRYQIERLNARIADLLAFRAAATAGTVAATRTFDNPVDEALRREIILRRDLQQLVPSDANAAALASVHELLKARGGHRVGRAH